jgi:penicillin-insensitive murein endopeptidase
MELAMTASGVPIQPKDSRGYFMLPQAPEDAGYYVYGDVHHVPGTGHLAQYAHPNMLTMIFQVEREWQAICDRKFGIGNISIDGGKEFDLHKTHQRGIEMDCRPVRKDYMTGPAARCSYQDKAVYDCPATIRLITLFVRHPWVRLVYFNDPEVKKAVGAPVKFCMGHNDHFHVELWPRYAL